MHIFSVFARDFFFCTWECLWSTQPNFWAVGFCASEVKSSTLGDVCVLSWAKKAWSIFVLTIMFLSLLRDRYQSELAPQNTFFNAYWICIFEKGSFSLEPPTVITYYRTAWYTIKKTICSPVYLQSPIFAHWLRWSSLLPAAIRSGVETSTCVRYVLRNFMYGWKRKFQIV